MKRLFRIFELSNNEQRVVLMIVFAVLTVAFIGYERRIHYSPAQPAPVREPKPSPTAVERIGDQ
jgi:hypothetical protein